MKEGWFAPQALAWAFFGPISEAPAAYLTMKKSDLHDDVQAASAFGTELENPLSLRCFAAETGGRWAGSPCARWQRREPKMRERAQNENLLILSVPPYRVFEVLLKISIALLP